MSGMFTALSRAVAGITCITPIAPTRLRFDWSSPDSWYPWAAISR